VNPLEDTVDALRDLMIVRPAWTLAVAESLTSGHLQVAIGARSGASDFFLGGLTAYTIDQKVTHLGVDREEADRTNAVSEKVADQMALGVCRLFGSNFGAATTGYAEASPETGIDSPLAFWALAHLEENGLVLARRGIIEMPGLDRVMVQRTVSEKVLSALLEYLSEVREKQ
jgi:nicotinamide-nucleotide amidase